jgi:nitrile hydratase beta subunit
MNGIHDVGGMHGLGAIVPEPNEPAFHAAWEGRMHGIAVTCQISGVNATPEQRATIERMPPKLYLETSYYEKWLYAYERILAAKGIITTQDIDRRVAEQAAERMVEHPLLPERPSEYAAKVRHVIMNGTPHDRPLDRPALFKAGDRVRARNLNPTAHNRLPGFTKGKVGVVDTYHGAHLSHEPLSTGDGEVPEHIYAVRFEASELWGPSAEVGSDAVYVDLFEHYLEAAV